MTSQQEEEASKNQDEGKLQLNNYGPDNNNIALGDNLTKQLIR